MRGERGGKEISMEMNIIYKITDKYLDREISAKKSMVRENMGKTLF